RKRLEQRRSSLFLLYVLYVGDYRSMTGRLPAPAAAAVSAAATAAISTAAAVTASAATAITACARALFARARLIHGQRAAIEHRAVKGRDRGVRFGIRGHLDEAETLGLP